MVVNYASSKEGADRVVTRLTGKGEKRSPSRETVSSRRTLHGFSRKEKGIWESEHPGEQRRGYIEFDTS